MIKFKKFLFLSFFLLESTVLTSWSSDDGNELKFCQTPLNVKLIKEMPPTIYKKVTNSPSVEGSEYQDILPVGTVVNFDSEPEQVTLVIQEPESFWEEILENQSYIYYNSVYQGEETLVVGCDHSGEGSCKSFHENQYTIDISRRTADMLGDVQNENHFSWFKTNTFKTFLIECIGNEYVLSKEEIFKTWMRILRPDGKLVYLSGYGNKLKDDQINLYKDQFLKAGFKEFNYLNSNLEDSLNINKVNHLVLQIADQEIQNTVKHLFSIKGGTIIIVTK